MPAEEEQGSQPPPPPPDPWKERDMISKAAVWLVFFMALLATTLLAIYTCTWLGEYEYNVQIARHVVILLWLFFLTMCYTFPKMWSAFYIFPKPSTTTFFLVGFAYVFAAVFMFSDPTLELLYKGNIGVHYTVQGTRTLPRLDPRKLFNAVIGMYSAIGGVGILFWAAMTYFWVTGTGNA